MNKSIGILLLGFLSFAGLQSCQKYEDGPAISLRTRTQRVCNTWKIDSYKFNGNDYTSLAQDYTETYTKAMNYSFTWGVLNGSGKWAFQNNDMEIRITGTDNQSSETLFIQKLEEKQFWYYYMDGTDKYEYHLIEK